MIRIELFLCPESRAVGLELQFFRFNAQLNVGLRLLFKLEGTRKPILSGLVGVGPLAAVAWIDKQTRR